MKNHISLNLKIHSPLFVNYRAQVVRSIAPVITQHIEPMLKKTAAIVASENLQVGMLHLFFGEKVADGYNHGNNQYYEAYYKLMPSALSEWLCSQLLETEEILVGELFDGFAYASAAVRKHVERLSALGVLSPLVTHTAFFPAVYPAPFKGIANAIRATYSPYPKEARETYADADSVRSMLLWAVERSKERMLVSLQDASSVETLQALQKTYHTEHQLKILDAITQGYEDALLLRANDLNIFIPSSVIQTKINYAGIRFCSYETFLHLSDSENYENAPFAATNILNQLNSDYLHHGLTLTAKELALFLKLHLSTRSDELMLSEVSAEAFYKKELGKSILHRYVSGNQLEDIVRSHRMLQAEKHEREAWHYNITKIDLPPRLHKCIKQTVLPFNEMYVVTLDNRKEFFNALKPLYKQLGYSFDGYFSGFIKLLLDSGCNVKYVTQAYGRFTYSPNYIHRYPFLRQKNHYTLDLNFLHDFYAVLHPIVVKFFYILTQHNDKKEAKKVANVILKSILSYNLDTSSSLTHLTKLLNSLIMKTEKSVLMQKEVLTKLTKQSSITSVIALCEDRELQIDNLVLYTIKHALHVEERHLKMASKMMLKESYIDLCSDLSSRTKHPQFHTVPQDRELLKERFNFKVAVMAHNNPIALLGPGLSGVCIDLGSIYHYQQLNPSFMNLCVYDDNALVLWGLLCRAKSQDNSETVYILNNFQGSINNHRIDAKQVKIAVIDVLQEFSSLNNIDAIFLKDQFFNTVNLCDGLSSIKTVRNKYLLEKNARLDFEVNTQGVVQQDKFYILNALEKVV